MPEEEIELSASEEKGWLGKIKDSVYQNWQTILVALIVLIVGISAYNYNEKTGANPAGNVNQEQQGAKTDAAATTENKEETAEAKDQAAAATDNTEQQTQETATQTDSNVAQQTQETKIEETKTNTVESNGEGYKVVAEKGDGITHLARKALAQYLSENNDSEITALHKIYIEDYLQNGIGNQVIEIGHAETISKASIQEAVAASKKLSQNSLDNLKKYSAE
ncbi:MAG: hypothetical protein WCQ96_00670 [Patescibacteria group bacterium]